MRRVSDTHWIISRRNALALIHQLDSMERERPAISGDGVLLQIEDDDLHYGERSHGPGRMSWEDSDPGWAERVEETVADEQ